jgi:hypothetical protein
MFAIVIAPRACTIAAGESALFARALAVALRERKLSLAVFSTYAPVYFLRIPVLGLRALYRYVPRSNVSTATGPILARLITYPASCVKRAEYERITVRPELRGQRR